MNIDLSQFLLFISIIFGFVDFRISFGGLGLVWARNEADGFVMRSDLLVSVKVRFDAVGIEIPISHRTLVFKNQTAALSSI